MKIRVATVKDIPRLMTIRFLVKENVLSDPSLVTKKDCEEFLTGRGKGWVCEIENAVVGFAIVDMIDHNVWALFIQPDFDHKGIGRKLHDEMLNWYFSHTNTTLWLGTAPNTRAEKFYRMQGWREIGLYGKGEIKFEMSVVDWKSDE